MKRQNVRTLSLIVFTFTYLLVGAAVFDALESSHEVDLYEKLHQEEKHLREKYKINKDDFENMTNLIIKMKPYKAGTQWKFAGSFYFATTVITTIGYGHSTPKTNGGKIFCMLYALPGIPLCIVMFQSIGERMNTFITSAIKFFKHRLNMSIPHEVSHTSLMIISSNITVVVIISGAAVFEYYEKWGYLNSFYYCFITLTTIGFGDFVALQRNDTLAKRPDYVAFSLIFILFGLTVVSSVMNLLVLRFLTMNTEDERRDEIQAAAAAVYAYDQIRNHNNSISNGIIDSNNVNYRSPVPFHDIDRSSQTISVLKSLCCCCNSLQQQPADVIDAKFENFKRRKRQDYDDISRAYNHIRTNCCFNFLTASVFPTPSTPATNVNDSSRKRKRYTVIRAPAKVHHLAHSNCSNFQSGQNRFSKRQNLTKTSGKDPPETDCNNAQTKFSNYLYPPHKSFFNNNQFSSQNSVSTNKNSNDAVSVHDANDLEDILLDHSYLNSIKQTKRASI